LGSSTTTHRRPSLPEPDDRKVATEVKRPTTTPDVLFALGIFLLGFLYLHLFQRLGWFLQDEGDLYYPFLRTLRGDLPYRDFYTGYPPMVYYIHAFLFRHFEVAIPISRTFMGLVNATTAAMLFLVTRRIATRGFALLPSLLFLGMQPAVLMNMVFQNAPYHSWHAVLFYVLTTWTVLRALETAAPNRRAGWLLAAGFLAGLCFLSKQNAGIFLLWAVSGFLASAPLDQKAPAAGRSPESPGLRLARVGYLALIPIAATILVWNYLTPLTLALFVAPTVVLGKLGARARFTASEGRALLGRVLLVGAGFAVAFVPWLVYFGQRIGYTNFLRRLLVLPETAEQNMFIPFPQVHLVTLVILGPLVLVLLFSFIRHLFSGGKADRVAAIPRGRTLWMVLIGTAAVFAGAVVGRFSFVTDLLRMKMGPSDTYLVVSHAIDNLAAYGSVLFLAAGLAVAWRQGFGHALEDDPPPTAFLWLVWSAACAYILYFPRMDAAHLYFGAIPMLYVVAAAILRLARTRLTGVLSGLRPQAVRAAFNLTCVLLLVFVIGSRSIPRIHSRLSIERTERGLRVTATDIERLDLPRAGIYFPVYDERHRPPIVYFRTLVRYIQSQTDPADPIFTFPALPMVYFVSGRDNPTRYNYFFGNNVSFNGQMEVVRTLEERRVPLVIIFNNPSEYFMEKARDFTRLIREYLGRLYYLDKRIGPYDVLRRYGTREAPARASGEKPDL
jgi:hypothetical protein